MLKSRRFIAFLVSLGTLTVWMFVDKLLGINMQPYIYGLGILTAAYIGGDSYRKSEGKNK